MVGAVTIEQLNEVVIDPSKFKDQPERVELVPELEVPEKLTRPPMPSAEGRPPMQEVEQLFVEEADGGRASGAAAPTEGTVAADEATVPELAALGITGGFHVTEV